MWECPDFFELDGRFVFLFSPQGMDAEDEQYLNLYQNGYVVGDFDYETFQFNRNSFKELDHGHDFYAPQTMLAPDGRRILIGWMAMWENTMPEKEDGWSGALTLPRELQLINNHLYMRPIEELKNLRIDSGSHQSYNLNEAVLLSNDKKQLEINLDIENKDFTIQFNNSSTDLLSIQYDAKEGKFTLYRNDVNDYRYASIVSCETVQMQLYVDTSSVEIFINQGEAVFTARFYSEEAPEIWVSSNEASNLNTSIYELEQSTIQYN